jgi:hypothetical protein
MLSRFVRAAGTQSLVLGSVAVTATLLSAVLRTVGASEIAVFVATAVALAALA